MPTFRQYGLGELNLEDAREIARLIDGVWPAHDQDIDKFARKLLAEHQSVPGHVLFAIWDDTRAVGHAALFSREIRWEDGQMTIMALCGLCVAKEHRGKKLGKWLATEVFKYAAGGPYPVVLFQTGIPDFYEPLGAGIADNEFWNSRAGENTKASPWWDPYAMIFPASATWPKGRIDLNGPGF